MKDGTKLNFKEKESLMLGAIVGDICGSVFEFANSKSKDAQLFAPGCGFTDDSVLTIALADTLLTGRTPVESLRLWGNRYPDAGYGGLFLRWLKDKTSGPYGSFGNGAAMRVSPAGWAANSVAETLDLARVFCLPTHDHPDGIAGGQAVALAIYLARTGASKRDIHGEIEKRFKYDLSLTCDEIREEYLFDETCQGTVPQALTAFFEAADFEDCLRNAISLGGDSDTLAAIACSVAEGFYGIPHDFETRALEMLDRPMRLVIDKFRQRFVIG